MAFCVNNENTGSFLFLNKDEILITDHQSTQSFKNIRNEHKILKCVPSVADSTSLDPDNSNSETQPANAQSVFTSAAVSKNCDLVAAGDSNNRLHLWEKTQNQEWKVVCVRPLTRKCQKIIFTNSASEIILVDRSGDVFSFSVSKYDEPPRVLTGHICLILDIAISCNDKYLGTCDRDGKIRVSCFPNCYEIYSFCLGHQEFVTSIKFLPGSEETLLSCSGDGTLRVWELNGKKREILQLHESEVLCKHFNVSVAEQKNGLVALPDKCVLSENQVLFSVRSVIYNAKLKVCGVLFHLQCGIAVYHLPNFVLKQIIPLKTPPLDAVFTLKGDLFVLSKDKEAPLVLFGYNEDSRMFSRVEENLSPGVSAIVEFYKDHDQIPFQDDFVSLFKRDYDNDDDECKPVEKKNKTE